MVVMVDDDDGTMGEKEEEFIDTVIPEETWDDGTVDVCTTGIFVFIADAENEDFIPCCNNLLFTLFRVANILITGIAVALLVETPIATKRRARSDAGVFMAVEVSRDDADNAVDGSVVIILLLLAVV